MARVCGTINAATAQLVELIARVIEIGAWEGHGIISPAHWVAWRAGVSPGHARRLVAMASRLSKLPETRSSFVEGELSEEQVEVLCRHVPPVHDGEAAELARHATVSQLKRTLVGYVFDGPAAAEGSPEDGPAPSPELDPEPERREVGFGYLDDGSWYLSARLPADEGGTVETALAAARQALVNDSERPSWADALLAVADASLAAPGAARPADARHLVLFHVRAGSDGNVGHLHLGPALPPALRRSLGCDGRTALVAEAAGRKAIDMGRTVRIVPRRTRIAVEERDRGCRVPGCDRRRWLQVHHIVHWEDGGGTDTPNLVALCSKHHRLHHQGQLGIAGDADSPRGLAFTDARGRPLPACGRPDPPPPGWRAEAGNWLHPSGERLDRRWVHFNLPPRTPAAATAAAGGG